MTDRDERLPEFTAGAVVGGKYRIERLVGAGGMGAVYSARHTGTGRGVAVKFLLANEPDLRRRMQREAMALGALAHPNVVGVLDVGEHDGTVFLVMELLAGKSLRDYVDGLILTPAEAIGLLMPALQGVEAAHRAGILHRDLKPDNLFVLLDDEGVPFDTKVLDFGIARPIAGRGAIDITRSGAVVGTPKYMAPEQLRGSRDLGPPVDVFAIGLILYELTVGRSPYEATSYESLIIEIATQVPMSPKIFSPDLTDDYVAVLLRSLEKRPSARFATILEFARALEPFAPGVRFVVPRRAHVASLIDSEESLMPTETPPEPILPWVEEASSESGRPSREATSPGRPRPAFAAELAATAAPTVSDTPSSRSAPAVELPLAKGIFARRSVAIAVVLLGLVAVSAATLFASRSDSGPTPIDPSAPANPPAVTEPTSPSAPAAPTAATAPNPPTDPGATSPVEETDPRRSRPRPTATVAPSTAATVVAPPVEPAREATPTATATGTREAHGRAGTIRTEDF